MKNLQFEQTNKTNDALPECLCVVHPALEEVFFFFFRCVLYMKAF